MLKKIIIIIFILNPPLIVGSSEKEVRVKIKGQFTLCSNVHFFHKKCRDKWKERSGACPICSDKHLVNIKSIFCVKNDVEECVICLNKLDEEALK